MSNISDFGAALGRAIATRTGATVEHSLPVNAVTVTVDTAPIADAVARLPAPVVHTADLSGVAAAIAGLPAVDLKGVVEALSKLSGEVGGTGTLGALEAIVSAVEANTAAIAANTTALREQTDVLRMDKAVTYDEQGRVLRVKVI